MAEPTEAEWSVRQWSSVDAMRVFCQWRDGRHRPSRASRVRSGPDRRLGNSPCDRPPYAGERGRCEFATAHDVGIIGSRKVRASLSST